MWEETLVSDEKNDKTMRTGPGQLTLSDMTIAIICKCVKSDLFMVECSAFLRFEVDFIFRATSRTNTKTVNTMTTTKNAKLPPSSLHSEQRPVPSWELAYPSLHVEHRMFGSAW